MSMSVVCVAGRMVLLLIATEKSLGAERKEFFLSHVALELKAASMKRHKSLAFQHKDLFQDRALEIHVYHSPAQRW